MFHPAKVLDIELSHPLPDIEGLDGYGTLRALVRLHGIPLGYVILPLADGCCPARALRKAIMAQYSWAILCHLVEDGLTVLPLPGTLQLAELLHTAHPVYEGPQPLVTVAVCTRDRTDSLSVCLDSLCQLDYPALDLLVIDNAPCSDATERLVRLQYPQVRYICEPRPGLNWARNRAILESRGEIVAYTDDDVVVDRGWVGALARVFVENPEVMAMTGLVVPYELETEAQWLFEQYGGFGRGFARRWYHLDGESRKTERFHIGAGRFGTGANMAYRRRMFEQIGEFDPALDVGTVTNGGGDLDMFFRVLQEGQVLMYEPSAVVRHRHRPEYAQLHTQLTDHGTGFYAYLTRNALAYPGERFAILRFGVWWLWWWNVRRLLISFVYPHRFPRALIVAELVGSLKGLVRYQKARRVAATIAYTFGPVEQATAFEAVVQPPAPAEGTVAPAQVTEVISGGVS
jgi:glycosyltransferase involved in cell wall biosynthesis